MKLKKGGRVTGRCLAGTLLAALTALPLQAETVTVTIGKGSGIVWEGLPFTTTLSGPMQHGTTQPHIALLAISNQPARSMSGEFA